LLKEEAIVIKTRTNLLLLAALVALALYGQAFAQWAEPKSIAEINSDYHDKSPFLSYDGLTLTFPDKTVQDGTTLVSTRQHAQNPLAHLAWQKK